MLYKGIDIANPFFWIFFTGLFAGFALADGLKIIIRKKRGENRSESKDTRLVSILLFITISVIFGTLGVFIPGSANFIQKGILAFLGISACFGFLCWFFKRTAGLPILLFTIIFYVFFLLLVKGWGPVPEDNTAAFVRTLSVENNRSSLEIVLPSGGVVFGVLDGEELAADMEILSFSSWFILRPYVSLYRIEGISGDTGFLSMPDTRGHSFFKKSLEVLISALPVFSIEQVRYNFPRPGLLERARLPVLVN